MWPIVVVLGERELLAGPMLSYLSQCYYTNLVYGFPCLAIGIIKEERGTYKAVVVEGRVGVGRLWGPGARSNLKCSVLVHRLEPFLGT